MFVLKNTIGDVVLMKDGQPFVYTLEELARMGAKHLGNTHGHLTVSML